MKPKTIAIVGGSGKMGSLFAKAFEKAGIEVIISGRSTPITNVQAAALADIVIVTVPIRNTREIIDEIAPHVKEDALLTDFTSVKINPIKAMLKSRKCEVAGGHPLFGPSVGFEGQNFILCPTKRVGKYYDWYKDFLKEFGLNVLEMSAKEHDKNMAVIQSLIHFSNITLADSLRRLNFNLDFAQNLASPVYKLRVYNIARVIAQDETLYSDIQIENPYSKKMSKLYYKSVKELYDSVEQGDKDAFEKIFKMSKTYFNNLTKKSVEITDKLIKLMSKNG